MINFRGLFNNSVLTSNTARAKRILRSNAPGAWYDPSDLTTLYQDSAGTTPVTAVEQPVGKILDKSGRGNHLIQPTATSRPTLSSRYNLLTKTEQFDDAAVWLSNTTGGGSAPVRVANDAVAPDGTTTADKITFSATVSGDQSTLTQNSTGLITSASYTTSVYVKAATGGDVGKVILYRPVAAAWMTAVTLTAEYQRLSLTANALATATDGLNIGLRPALGGSTGTVSVHIWGASLTTAADASLPYQRVNTATDYDFDFSKFPPYLRFDGVDDGMYTAASVDFTSTDKMTVFAGVHKASEVGTQTLLEMSPNKNSNTGVFAVFAPITGGNGDITWASKGTVEASAVTVMASPATRVFTGIGDIAGDNNTLRLNGVQWAQNTTDQGTGNFGNYPLYVGRRNNASFPFSGRIYQLAIKGKSLSAGEVSTLESYVNNKTKAYDPYLRALLTEAGDELATESNLFITLEQ